MPEVELIQKCKELYNALIVVNSIANDPKKDLSEQLSIINILSASQLSKANNIVF
jgi:hypothetical protein